MSGLVAGTARPSLGQAVLDDLNRMIRKPAVYISGLTGRLRALSRSIFMESPARWNRITLSGLGALWHRPQPVSSETHFGSDDLEEWAVCLCPDGAGRLVRRRSDVRNGHNVTKRKAVPTSSGNGLQSVADSDATYQRI